MIDPKTELLRWGPIDSKIVYIYFMDPFPLFNKHFKPGWSDTIVYYYNDKILAICPYPKLRENGSSMFKKVILNEKITKKHFNNWYKTTKKLVDYEKKIKNPNKLNQKQLSKLFDEWNSNYEKFWFYGFIPELANWGGEKILKEKLLEKHKENFTELFEVLSAPEDLSFYQTEELNLLKLKLIKQLDKKLKEHQQKYHWLRNSYGYSTILPISYFKNQLNKVTKEEAEKKIKEIKNIPKKTKQNKKELINKYKVSKDIEKIGKRLAYSIWWQDFRKKFIFMAISQIEEFVKETSRRFNTSKEELYQYRPPELGILIKTGKKIKNALGRKEGYLQYYYEDKGDIVNYDTKEANEIMKPFLEPKVERDVKEFKGLPVSRGKAKGKVKIILSPLNIKKMNQGDILVAPMTSPDFVIAMKKAAAIITDEGGMTSHAAIVARELGIPCIVGTKIATKVLKDNDLVEVDANKGVVKKLK